MPLVSCVGVNSFCSHFPCLNSWVGFWSAILVFKGLGNCQAARTIFYLSVHSLWFALHGLPKHHTPHLPPGPMYNPFICCDFACSSWLLFLPPGWLGKSLLKSLPIIFFQIAPSMVRWIWVWSVLFTSCHTFTLCFILFSSMVEPLVIFWLTQIGLSALWLMDIPHLVSFA